MSWQSILVFVILLSGFPSSGDKGLAIVNQYIGGLDPENPPTINYFDLDELYPEERKGNELDRRKYLAEKLRAKPHLKLRTKRYQKQVAKRVNNTDKIGRLMDEQEKNPHKMKIYTNLIKELGMAFRLKEAFGVLGLMQRSGVLPDYSALSELARAASYTGDDSKIKQVLHVMQYLEIPPRVDIWNSRIRCFITSKHLKKAEVFFDYLEERSGIEPDRKTFNLLLEEYGRVENFHKINDLLQKMDEYGYQRDKTTYAAITWHIVEPWRRKNAYKLFFEEHEKDVLAFDSDTEEITTKSPIRWVHNGFDHLTVDDVIETELHGPEIRRQREVASMGGQLLE